MKRKVFLDHESYWDEDISIRLACMKKYMRRSYSYLVSVISGPYKWAGTPAELRRNPDALKLIFDPNSELWATNSNFDQEWTEEDRCLPELRGLKTWNCVSDYAVYHQRPRDLERMHKALTGKSMDKGMRRSMKGVHVEGVFDFERENMRQYNLTDGVVAEENVVYLERLGPMSEMEKKIAAHTRLLGRRGIAVDYEFIEKCRQSLEWIRFNVSKEIPWAKTEKVLAPQAFNTYCCRHGVAPPANLRKTDDDFTAWMQANPKLGWLMKARQRYELANRKLSHIEKFLERTEDGVYYPDLLYCGAPHTRRWSAKGSSDGKQTDSETHSGFNIQNMDKMPIFGDFLPGFISPLPTIQASKTKPPFPGLMFRNFLVPRPGKTFLILDFSQVEPRCLNWLAGNEKFLQLIREGYALYEAFARSVGLWNEPTPLKDGPVAYYTLIKNIVIGAGYGMSGKKFARYAKIPEEQAIEEIQRFRKAAPMIPKFWYSMHDAIEQAWQSGGEFEVQMPNGEVMRRFGLDRYLREGGGDEKRWAYRASKTLGAPETVTDIYGAKMVENITQRMARDLLGEGLVRLEEAGLPVAFHAHDEVILEVDHDNREDALGYAKRLMNQVPDWAAGLPIACSGGIYERYTKA